MPTVHEASLAPKISVVRIFRRNRASVLGLGILTILIFIAAFAELLAPFDPMRTGAGPVLHAPDATHWMGTDELGRDISSRIFLATRTSLFVGLTAAGIATAIAIVVGALAGYFGRLVDDALMRVTEIFQVVPRFFLAILLVAFFGANIVNIILAIALLSWPEVARVVRSEFLSLRTRRFVAAAQVAGAATPTLIFVEILPNAMGPIIVNATLQIGQAILLEAGLSYLGLGDPRQVSLGLMLYQAQEIMRSAWWSTAFPGLFVFLAVLSVNLVGDGLNDVFNPRARGR